MLGKKFGSPLITNGGVTIAKDVEIEDAFENMGAQLVREVASKTNDIAGDGTTTATLLAQAIVHEGLKTVSYTHLDVYKRQIGHNARIRHIRDGPAQDKLLLLRFKLRAQRRKRLL